MVKMFRRGYYNIIFHETSGKGWVLHWVVFLFIVTTTLNYENEDVEGSAMSTTGSVN